MTKHPSEPKEKIPKDLMVGTQTSEQQEIAERMRHIKHKIIILSGKGGVGKTTVAINLATSLAWQGHTIGILDADIHGPDVPKMLGLEGARMVGGDKGLEPVIGPLNILTVSMDSFSKVLTHQLFGVALSKCGLSVNFFLRSTGAPLTISSLTYHPVLATNP